MTRDRENTGLDRYRLLVQKFCGNQPKGKWVSAGQYQEVFGDQILLPLSDGISVSCLELLNFSDGRYGSEMELLSSFQKRADMNE